MLMKKISLCQVYCHACPHKYRMPGNKNRLDASKTSWKNALQNQKSNNPYNNYRKTWCDFQRVNLRGMNELYCRHCQNCSEWNWSKWNHEMCVQWQSMLYVIYFSTALHVSAVHARSKLLFNILCLKDGILIQISFLVCFFFIMSND